MPFVRPPVRPPVARPSVLRSLAALLAVLAVLVPAGAAHALPCWQPPVEAPVTDPFRAPSCRWCPGNRGIEFGTAPGTRIRAVATGRVTFAGSVADTVYVVIRHAGGRRVTYANLRPTSWSVGELVVRGQTVGRAAGRFHLGVRVGDRYVDPAPLLGRWVHRARLVPVDGGAGNPPPPPRLRCGSSGSV